jgi:hypothetical protein
MLDAGDELFGLLPQPAGAGGARAARHDVQQAGVQASVGVAGQFDHRGHRESDVSRAVNTWASR